MSDEYHGDPPDVAHGFPASDGPRALVVRRRGEATEYGRGDFGQVFVPSRAMATDYPDAVAREVMRVWGSYADGWTYSVETLTADSDEMRKEVCCVCGMDPLDRRGEGEACTACGGGIARDEPRVRGEFNLSLPIGWVGDIPVSAELDAVMTAVLAEVARLQAKGESPITVGEGVYDHLIHAAARYIREAIYITPAGGA